MDSEPWWKGARGEWYVIAQGFFFALVALGPRTWAGLPEWAAPWDGIGGAAGLALMILGGLLSLAGVLHLGANLTALPHPKDEATMVETGAYALVRHPIYSGLILAAFGWALWRNGWLTLAYAALLLVFFDLKSRREERWLRRKFSGYADYQRRVRKLIPFIY
jgi:protein-S-isoprenylcysteine O-methyltransferase Ste14